VHFRLTETLGNFAGYQIRPSEFEAWQHVSCERKKSWATDGCKTSSAFYSILNQLEKMLLDSRARAYFRH
jgi:hypothetical protein